MYTSTAHIDLDILGENIRSLQATVRDETEIIFVVKSNAYGHGLEAVAEKAAACGIRWFGVAYLQEALRVRKVVPAADILIMGVVEPSDVRLCIRERFTPIIVCQEQAEAYASEAGGAELQGHIKIDTGMGRLGVAGDRLEEWIPPLCNIQGLRITGICSHFATVEPKRPELGEGQVELFHEAVAVAEAATKRKLMRHISSTRAVQRYLDWDFDAIRPGMLLYGYGAKAEGVRCLTKPFMQWRSRLMQVRSVPADFSVGYYASYRTKRATDIGVICTGYADGFVRTMSNRGFVLAGGRRCPVVGRISMNWVMIELGENSGLRFGDEVVLMGEQDGESLWADEISEWASTIPYEVLTAISASTPRFYTL